MSEMDETEQTLLELEGLKRSMTDSMYWRAVIEDAITLIKKQKLELDNSVSLKAGP